MTYTEPLILVFGLIALAGLVRRRRALATIGILGFLFVSWPPVDWLLARPLEARYSGRLLPASGAQAIVVLLSAVQMPRSNRPYPVPDQATFERGEYAAWLYHHWRHLPVLVCGGPERAGGRPTSTAMREMLEREGIPETTIWTEERSRSTHENAAYGAEVLRSHGISTIALVVEAQSMLGAEACFRKQGITVVPAASGYREWGSVVLDARLDIVYVGVERSTPVTPTAPTRRPATLAEAPCIPKGWLTRRQPPPLADRHAG